MIEYIIVVGESTMAQIKQLNIHPERTALEANCKCLSHNTPRQADPTKLQDWI